MSAPVPTVADSREPRSLRGLALALLAVAALQTAVLAWMVYDRIVLVTEGREIVLDTVPIDPRSLFRGDYVILNYRISRIDPALAEGDPSFERGQEVYVTLKPDETATAVNPERRPWIVASLAETAPKGTVGDDRVVLRGRVSGVGETLGVRYGIESYFVPEGEGKDLERLVRDRKVQVLVAVSDDGETAIKGLLIDGVTRYEEPLF